MFNLDQAVAEWRRQMLAVGIKTPVPLDELESHLHEEIEEQMKSGLNAQQAFDAGVLKIGQAHALKNEFNKVPPQNFEIRTILPSNQLTPSVPYYPRGDVYLFTGGGKELELFQSAAGPPKFLDCPGLATLSTQIGIGATSW